MELIKEKVISKCLALPANIVLEELIKGLRDRGFEVEKSEQDQFRFSFKCLIELINFGAWRCWAERVIVDCKELEENKTYISVFAVPSWFRISVKKTEKVHSKAGAAEFLNEIINRSLTT